MYTYLLYDILLDLIYDTYGINWRSQFVAGARMKVHSLQTVGELITAIKTAARADDLNMMLAFNSEAERCDWTTVITVYGLD